jgi:hypothetical protein
METENRKASRERFRASNSGRALGGLVLIALGGVWLAHEMGLLIPDWVLSPFMIPIVIGIFMGARRMFRPGFWVIFVVFGLLLIGVNHYDLNKDYFWPMAIILFGLWMVLKPRKMKREWDGWRTEPDSPDNMIDANSVFGGTKKKVLSKDFKGGEINTIFGGNDVDFSQADINGSAILEVNIVFGGTKLIVPAHWHVKSEADCVFGSVEDKRRDSNQAVENKTLVIKGSVVFGSIEIKSY